MTTDKTVTEPSIQFDMTNALKKAETKVIVENN